MNDKLKKALNILLWVSLWAILFSCYYAIGK